LETREQGGIAAISLSWKLVADLQGNPIDDGLESSQGGVPGGLPPEQNPGAIVVDWPSRNFLRGGPGKFWNLIQGGYSGNFWRTPNRQYNTQDYSYARWYPQVGPRRYEIYVYIPNLANVTTSATYYVHSQDGYQFVKINQRANQGKWVSLGTYNFLGYYSEFDEKISLSSVTGEPDQSTFVVWDGLQAVPR
jgi:hypothetical protein